MHEPPDRERLPAHSRAEDERILLARTGFMTAFVQDPRVAAFFTDVDRSTGLLAAAARFAPLATTLAHRIGVPHRSALWLMDASDLATAINAVPVTADYEALVQQTMHARADAVHAYEHLDHAIVAARLEVFVRELGTPWRWLAIDLAEMYCHVLFFERLLGTEITRQVRVTIGVPAASLFRLHPGEDVREAYARLTATVAAQARRYLAARRSKQAGPKSDGRHLERYGAWFYRLKVKDEPDPVRRVARDYQEQPSNIKRGVAVVEPLLDLPSERFPPG